MLQKSYLNYFGTKFSSANSCLKCIMTSSFYLINYVPSTLSVSSYLLSWLQIGWYWINFDQTQFQFVLPDSWVSCRTCTFFLKSMIFRSYTLSSWIRLRLPVLKIREYKWWLLKSLNILIIYNILFWIMVYENVNLRFIQECDD